MSKGWHGSIGNIDSGADDNADNDADAVELKCPSSSSSSPSLLPFHSRRSPVYCTGGCVASSQPLASSIGLHVLRALGGNAADASVAVAAALAVTEPCSTGLGGDAFALWYDSPSRKVRAVNGSGKSPGRLTMDVVRRRHPDGNSGVDEAAFRFGVHSVTVPGAARCWEDVFRKFGSGRVSFRDLLEPAAKLAEEGFPVSPITAMHWTAQMDSLMRWHGNEGEGDRVELSMDEKGRGPKAGELFRNPGMAAVLRSLGDKGATEGFYEGFPGQAIVDAVRKHGGTMTLDDLSSHASTFPEPISVNYRGVDVWQVPPNGQGVAGLIALEGLSALESGGVVEPALVGSSAERKKGDEQPGLHRNPHSTAELFHAQIEMMRLGFGDARAYVCDPNFHKEGESKQRSSSDPRSNEWLLDKERIGKRAIELFDIDEAKVQGMPSPTSCTVSFQVVDGEGNAMSFVNSNYMGFGTGLVPKGCSFTLQNRGAGFVVDDPDHPNALAPGKRPFHTIIPAILTHGDTGDLYATLSNMGGFMQPQGHMQLAVGMVANGLDPQAAIDAPRFCIIDGTQSGVVLLEDGVHPETIDELKRRGHKMKSGVSGYDRDAFGRAQIIRRDRDTGVLCAGSDGRADGCAMGY